MFRKGKLGILMVLLLVLYCSKKHGDGKPLADYHLQTAPEAPSWARNGVLYEIFIRQFTPEGTFRAAEKYLPDLKSLGVNILWLMPIYPIGVEGRKGSAGSPYSVRDYRAVNPELGTAADFRHFVRKAHQFGLKVILDIVPNHSSNDNSEMKTHPEWFERDKNGQFTREVADWSDVTDFNYKNPGMRKFMTDNLLYWLKNFDIDGYRCDVAGMVPFDFWKKVLPRLREAKPDIFLLAEWEDPRLLVAGFNSDYDWTLYHILKDIRKGRKRTSVAIQMIAQKDGKYPRNALPMRFLENHDEQRSLSVFGAEAISAYASLIFTLPGIPLLYAGQEWGARQRPALFEKQPLNRKLADTTLVNFYRKLIAVRRRYSCFRDGNYIPLQTLMATGSAAAFLREDDSTAAVVICNLRGKTAEKIRISLNEVLDSRWKETPFVNIFDPADTLKTQPAYFNEMLPYTTQIYVAEQKTKQLN